MTKDKELGNKEEVYHPRFGYSMFSNKDKTYIRLSRKISEKGYLLALVSLDLNAPNVYATTPDPKNNNKLFDVSEKVREFLAENNITVDWSPRNSEIEMIEDFMESTDKRNAEGKSGCS